MAEPKKRRRLWNALCALIIAGGVAGIFYPAVSGWINGRGATRAVESYDGTVEALEAGYREDVFAAARAYNEEILARNGFDPPVIAEGDETPPAEAGTADAPLPAAEGYDSLLNVNGDGVMGYLTLPRLDETVPVYHGTSETVLQSGIGHLEGTSLPVGGPSTHAALSGHRGLPNRQLFTDLDQMRIGDVFYITVLGETLAYEVDQILTVLPTELEALAIGEGEDYVTLITCTPYGVNSHRLLVRGKRVPYEQAEQAERAAALAEPERPVAATHTNSELFVGLYVLAVFFAARYIVRDGRRYRLNGRR